MARARVKPFYLLRLEDTSGVSGTGIVSIGAQLPSGKCVMEFQSVFSSMIIFNNIHSLETVHGHEGKTKVMWGHPPVAVKKKRKKSGKKVRKLRNSTAVYEDTVDNPPFS